MIRMLRLCLVALAAAPLAAAAQDQLRTQDRGASPQHDLTPDQDRTRLQIRDKLLTDKSATEADLAALDPEIASYAKAEGDPKELRTAAREAAGTGCKGACLKETIRTMNAEMSRGATSVQARERAMAAVHEQARKGAAAAEGSGAGTQARDQERARERTQDRTQSQSHQGGGKGGGGPK